MTSAFTAAIQLLESGVLSTVAKELPALQPTAIAVCNDYAALGRALTNAATSTKLLIVDAGPLIGQLKKDMAP